MTATPSSPFRLDGRVVAITGGCGILGRAFAGAFTAAGASVVLLDLGAADPAAVASELAAGGERSVTGVACDVASEADIERAVGEAEAAAGPIDVLVNNAASKSSDVRRFFEPAEDFDADIWREVMAVNLDGMFLVARSVAKRMLARETDGAAPRGSIVQIASVYGVVAPDQRIYEGSHYLGGAISTPPIYSASKAGVIGLTRHLATCWGPRGVRVNCVSPGGVFSGQNDEFRNRYSARVPLGRMGESHEIASAVVFLSSPAASYINGHNLVVDGGMSIW